MGRVLNGETLQPPASGQVFIGGKTGLSYPLDEVGRFEIPNLLPGVYKIEVQVAGRANASREILLDTATLSLDILLPKLN